MKKTIKPFRPVYPTPAGLVTSVDRQGRPNIITLGEIYNLSIREPVMVGIGIAPQRYSHQLISETREFVVNLPTVELLEKVDRCGSVSGRDADKFALTGLTPLPARVVRPPLIEECPVNIECQLVEVVRTSDHDLFIGNVVAVHVDAECLDEREAVRYDKLRPLAYLTGQYWSLGSYLASHGFTRKK